MYQEQVRSTTAGTGKTVLAIVAILSLLLSFFVIAPTAVAAAETVPLHNTTTDDVRTQCAETDAGEMLFHFVLNGLDDGTTVQTFAASFDTNGDGTADVTYTLADDNVELVPIESGNFHINVLVEGEATLVTASATVSDQDGVGPSPKLVLSHICDETHVPTPSLTLDKVAVGGDSEFAFELNDVALSDTLSGADAPVVLATTSGTFKIDELLSGAQMTAGWDLTSISCDGNAAAETSSVANATVSVTVGADEDVVCTFTNTLTAPTPTLTLDKVTVGGDSEFAFELDDVALSDTLSGADAPVVLATTSGTFTIDELISSAQADAGWDLTSIECTGNAMEESDDVAGATVDVTVGADEDVVCTFTNTLTPPPPPGEGFLEVDKLICLAETSSTHFDVTNVEIQTFNLEEEHGDVLEDIGDCILGANVTFSVYVDANGNQVLDEGEVLSDDDDLVDGTLTTNENGAITIDLAEGDYILVEAPGGIEQGDWPGGSVAFSIVDGELTLIEVTNNIAEENGLLKIRKFFCTIPTPEGFDNPDFTVLEGENADSDASLPDQFADVCSRGGDNPEATFTVDDGDPFVTDDGLLVIQLPFGEHTVAETEPNAGSIDVTIGEDVTSLLVLNFEEEEEQTGSITVQKEIQCEVCETFTPGFYFNEGENNEGSAFAEASLSADPITVGGMTFDSVQSVQDDAAPGSLLRHYLALVLNVRMGTADECDLAAVTYSGSMAAFEGMTIGDILDEAEAVLNGGSSEFTAEELHDVIDEINNADVGDDTLTCSGTTGLSGFDFVLTDEEDMEHTGTTDDAGMVVFDDLPLGTYTLEETGGPDGSDCTVVSASGDGVEFDAETGVITITLTSDMADVTVTVVNDCGGESGQQLGSITILKNAVPDDAQDFAFTTTGTGLTGFSLDDDADATLSNQKVFTSLAAGSYSVTESATAGWDLTSITCSAGGTADLAAGTANITLAEGADVTCTFVNTKEGQQAQTGSITILKNAVPDDAQDFAFTTTGTGLTGFSLDDDANVTLPNQKTFSGLAAGTYTVAEGSVAGWTLTSLTCSPSASVTVTGATASINLAAGANVTCTFVNTKQGSGTLPSQGGPTTTPRGGTLAGNLPNTATEPFSGTSLPVALVALAMLSGLGAAAYAMKAEAARRR